MTGKPPTDPADHAEEFGHCWADKLDEYCTIRMDELGIPNDKNGEQDPNRPKTWRAFVPDERTGGYLSANMAGFEPASFARWQRSYASEEHDRNPQASYHASSFAQAIPASSNLRS
jgi:hypothetical protein